MILALLLKFWQPALIVLVLGFGVQQCRARDQANVERGRALEQVRRADSTLKAIEPRLNAVSVKLVHDTVTVRRMITRTNVLRDTVLRHLTDTVIIKQFIEASDSVVSACRELASTCAQFRQFALAKFQADSVKLRAIVPIVSKSCTLPVMLSGGIGLVGGWAIGRGGFFGK